jgi:hypothetical protein
MQRAFLLLLLLLLLPSFKVKIDRKRCRLRRPLLLLGKSLHACFSFFLFLSFSFRVLIWTLGL